MVKYLLFLVGILATQVSLAQPGGGGRFGDTNDRLSPKPQEHPIFSPLPENAILTEPSSPLRAPGEWEEMQAIVISWTSFPLILSEIVRFAQQECKVMICVPNAGAETQARNYLTNRGIDCNVNVEFVHRDFNRIWVRDYGPNVCYTNDVDSLVMIDWIYNRPDRPKDDTLPYKIAEVLQVPIYVTNTAPNRLVHTGGNFMTDGRGLGFSSKLVLTENPTQPLSEVMRIMQTYHGLNAYALMNELPYDLIHHIDMHMKLLDEETLLVGAYPTGIADGPQIEANLQYVLSQFKTAFGKNFRVVRIPMPPDAQGRYPHQNGAYRTYTNAVFVNKTVILPTYEEKYDTTAIRIWQEALPGYKIQGINCNAIIGQSGAVHCITKEIGVFDPLWLTYPRIEDVAVNPLGTTYPLTALIKHKSGIAGAKLYYRLSTDTAWQSVSMSQISGSDNWLGEIPYLPEGSTVHYYVEATAQSGKQIAKPLPAPQGYYTFRILATSGIEPQPEQITDFKVFPNPARAITCVSFQLNRPAKTVVQLTDIFGRTVQTLNSGVLPSGDHKLFFQAENLPSGMYQVVLSTDEEQQVVKVLVQ